MNVYHIFITHNRAWSKREIIVFALIMLVMEKDIFLQKYGAAAGEFVELHFINAYGMFAAGDNGASSEIKKCFCSRTYVFSVD